MTYGYFDDDRCEYVITKPDTPRPWSNYMGSRKYGGIIANNGGGYSFTRSPASGRILRFRYNASPMDQPGRIFYLRDMDSGEFWSSSWQPVGGPLEDYESTCRLGTSYATFESFTKGIRTKSDFFIPLDEEYEVWRLTVKNESENPREIKVFSFCEFTNDWNIQQDLFNLQYTLFISKAVFEDGFIQGSSCERLGRGTLDLSTSDAGRFWWMTQWGGEPSGYDLDRDTFLGMYDGPAKPVVVQKGESLNSEGFGDSLCGSVSSVLRLDPGEEKEIVVLLGIGQAHKEGKAAKAKLLATGGVDGSLSALKSHWRELVTKVKAVTPDSDFDHMVNVWNSYNSLVTFEWSRSCSMVYTGDQRDGFGFRDTVQDFIGAAAMIPDLVRERLILMLSGQDATGGAQPEVRPWSHRPGSMTPTDPEKYRSDDCLWFFNAIPVYLAETGDMEFLHLVVPFADQGEGTVMGHLRRALEFNLERRGAHNLPCGLSADWNDCLKLGYHGESVFVAFQLRLGLQTYADLASRLGMTEEADWALHHLDEVDLAIQRSAWDGEWFIWAIGEDGTVYGTKQAEEGQVYLNTQVWSVISGAASPEQTEGALAAVRDRLATPYGIALCEPPFDKTSVEVMRAVLFNPSVKENGGIFTHTQSWAVIAEAMRGNGSLAYQYYRAYMPSAQNDTAEVRGIEPFVHCQSTHGRHSPKFGASRLPWLSGAVSWSCYTATHWILGFRPELDGVRIDPCVPKDWPGFRMEREFRGCRVLLTVENPHGLEKGVKRLWVDGTEIEGSLLPLNLLRDGVEVRAVIEP
jgi:N,N'-diacetylchitobiose phosphorylase